MFEDFIQAKLKKDLGNYTVLSENEVKEAEKTLRDLEMNPLKIYTIVLYDSDEIIEEKRILFDDVQKAQKYCKTAIKLLKNKFITQFPTYEVYKNEEYIFSIGCDGRNHYLKIYLEKSYK